MKLKYLLLSGCFLLLCPPIADADSSEDMQLAWDSWHRRIAGEVYTRFQKRSDSEIKDSRLLVAEATYTVTRKHGIKNVRLTKKSINPAFDSIIIDSIRSFDGDELLAFPQGAQRAEAEKFGTFTKNYKAECTYGAWMRQPKLPASAPGSHVSEK